MPTENHRRALSGIGETIWQTTRVKLPEGRQSEIAAQAIRSDKRMILYREYWRCPQCKHKVAAAEDACDECHTPRPAITLLNDKAEMETIVRYCKQTLKMNHKNSPMLKLGDLSLRELLMHCGVLLHELHEAKEKGLLG